MSRISWDQWVHRPRKTDCTWSIFLEDGIKRDLNGNAAPEEHTEMGNKINSSVSGIPFKVATKLLWTLIK